MQQVKLYILYGVYILYGDHAHLRQNEYTRILMARMLFSKFNRSLAKTLKRWEIATQRLHHAVSAVQTSRESAVHALQAP